MTFPSISDKLLVPMGVEAVVVNDPVLSKTAFMNGKYDYTKLADFISPAPDPFNDAGDPPTKGVHLHWELPAAFRHGQQPDENSDPAYPLVPNRWLVLRYWPGHTTQKRLVKAWVLLSDFLDDNLPVTQSNSFITPDGANKGKPTRIGKFVELNQFSEPDNSVFLQAVAPGNSGFSAFRPNVQNVFSFCDDGTDTSGNPLLSGPGQTIEMSYLVLGWFSDPASDPLHGQTDAADWAKTMAGMQWLTDPFPVAIAGASPPQKAFGIKGYGDISSQFKSGQKITVVGSSANDGTYTLTNNGVYDEADDHITLTLNKAMASSVIDGFIITADAPSTWPQATLTHGLIYNLAWQNDDLPDRPNATPQEIAKNVKLAVGNSSIDALAAMMIAEAGANMVSPAAANTEAAALEAFQTGMLDVLDESGGQARLDVKLREKWFEQLDGGLIWELVPNTDVNAGNSKPNSAQKTWLADINFFQDGLDRELRVLQSMQKRIYANWWRVQRINSGYVPQNLAGIWDRQKLADLITAALPDEAAQVKAQQQNVDAWQGKITAAIASPPSYTNDDNFGVEVQPPEWTGTQQALKLKATKKNRFYKPGDPVLLISGLGASQSQGDPEKSGQGLLKCRLGSDHISALTVDSETITLDELAALVTAPASTTLTAGIIDAATVLGVESLVLDPDNGPVIATAVTSPAADITATIRAGKDYTGQAPAPFSASPWQQAWNPLFLDWKLTYYPTVEAPQMPQFQGFGPQWSFDRANWEFNGRDYGWTGGDVTNPTAAAAPATYSITHVDKATNEITFSNAGNLGFAFPEGTLFIVSGATDLNGSYTVKQTSTAGDNFLIVTNETLRGSTGDGQARRQVELGGQVTYGGRTFLTPKSTYNFRQQLQNYIDTRKKGCDEVLLEKVAHLLDVIGGAQYDIQSANTVQKSFTVTSSVDLDHLFTVGSTCYVAQAKANDGTFSVASTQFDEANALFNVVVNEVVVDAGFDGILVPEPQEWDLLSQSLSGFNDQLIMRDLQPNAMANGDVASGPAAGESYETLTGQSAQDVPELGYGDTVDPALGKPSPYFFPVRGGFMALFELALVDRFGQKINLLYANNNAQFSNPQNLWQTFAPIRSRWLQVPANTGLADPSRLMQLNPRSASGARLDFRFVSAPDKPDGPAPDSVDIDLWADANPVCGWVLPNHIDDGLLVYDATGKSLGELAISHRSGGVLEVVWFATPQAANPIVDPTDPQTGIPNQYLRGFVAGIMGQPLATRGQAFANFLSAVDETLWAVDPLSGRSDQNLSVLVGRPLALVRSRIKLIADGKVPEDESTKFVLPITLPVSAIDRATNSVSIAVPTNYANTGQYQPGTTIRISGSTDNDGSYHIVSTSFSQGQFSLKLREKLPSSTVDGSLTPPAPTGTLSTTPFDLRLGRADLFDDGLIGYFHDKDFTGFNTVYLPPGLPPAGYLSEIGPGNYLWVTVDSECSEPPPNQDPAPVADAGSHYLTMLMDPRAAVHATTGILPTDGLTLPPVFYEGPMARLELNFRAGPLIVDSQAVRMPRPTEQTGTWSWVQRDNTGNATDSWTQDPITPVGQKARMSKMPQQLRDGWMKLTDHDFNDE